MHLDLEDQRNSVKKKAALLPYVVITTLSAITLIGFIYLQSTGWGIRIDLKKLADAFVINKNSVDGAEDLPVSADIASITNTQLPTIIKQTTAIRHSENYNPPNGARPLNWNVQLATFNRIFIQHPACNQKDMKWPQMECSNFRARAMKRFQEEWSKNSYWDGSRIVSNKAADARVNAELSL
jgi:hypothetical protein